MGRTTNYRSKITEIVCVNEQQRAETRKVVRMLDALEHAGVPESQGFCNQVAAATGYSRNRVSDVFSGKAIINPRFVKALCSAFGLEEGYIINGDGNILTQQINATGTDVAITEAVKVLQRMPELDRWYSVGVLKELEEHPDAFYARHRPRQKTKE